jgi:hypothetical protein
MHVAAKNQDRPSIVKTLASGDFQYTITLRNSNKTGGLRIDVEAPIEGVLTTMTDGICFGVMLCKCNRKQPQPHRPQAWPGSAEVVNLDKCHITHDLQRQGHGTRIMTELIRWYRESKTQLLTVSVPHAKKFYTKLGFHMHRDLGTTQMDVGGSMETSCSKVTSCSTLTLRGYNVILTCATGTPPRG